MVIDVLLEEKMIRAPCRQGGIRSFRGNAHARFGAGMPLAAWLFDFSSVILFNALDVSP
jgi:hypothetical protein